MANSEETEDKHLWKVDQGSEEDYWTAYESMRPKYADSSFLEIIYDYHSSKSSDQVFEVAHDVACGAGKAATEIAKRFQRVIASDSNLSSLTALQKSGYSNIECVQSTSEELDQNVPLESADLITAAQCFPILDTTASLSSFSRVLKPNGTMAAWFYGRPHFSEPDYRSRCQPLFDRILNLTFGMVIKGGPPEAKPVWKMAAEAMGSWLDNVEIPSGSWDRVQRIKWNPANSDLGFSEEAVDFEVEMIDRTSSADEMRNIEDTEMWKGSWNIAGVRKYVNYCFPGIEPAVSADEVITELFARLEKEMGGEHAIRPFTWPIVLLLASRPAAV